jgi:hypothetical protein
VLVALGTNLFGDETNTSLVVIIALVGVAVTILAGFIKRVATSYTITNRRLDIKLLQVGDVDFDTADGDDYNFVFAGVSEPADVVHMVDQASGAAAPVGLGDQIQTREAPGGP